MTLFFIFVIGVGYVFSYVMDSPGILFLAVFFSMIMSFVSYWWSDKIVLFMSRAKEVSRENNKQIYNLVENLCITAGLPIPKIYIMEDSGMNAFATGRNPEHGVIVLTSGLINSLEKTELEGVIAHELSHIGNRDILLSTVIVVLVGFITLLADWFMRWSFFGRRGGDRDKDKGQLGLIMIVVAIALSILSPIVAAMMQAMISRKREFLADADGALLTRYPEGLASALDKISQNSGIDRDNKATAHLYISNPFRKKGFMNKLFSTHPPIEERVKNLRGMKVE
ncbi:MAG: M48 family metallopeptidase [Parcubacteria group bacterium]|nr:M48 family metallopeptidase [Parcubacteria group bacterium]